MIWDELTTNHDRALHVPTMMNYKDFTEKLAMQMIEPYLLLHDGYGYTTFCYVAMTGLIDVVDLELINATMSHLH